MQNGNAIKDSLAELSRTQNELARKRKELKEITEQTEISQALLLLVQQRNAMNNNLSTELSRRQDEVKKAHDLAHTSATIPTPEDGAHMLMPLTGFWGAVAYVRQNHNPRAFDNIGAPTAAAITGAAICVGYTIVQNRVKKRINGETNNEYEDIRKELKEKIKREYDAMDVELAKLCGSNKSLYEQEKKKHNEKMAEKLNEIDLKTEEELIKEKKSSFCVLL